MTTCLGKTFLLGYYTCFSRTFFNLSVFFFQFAFTIWMWDSIVLIPDRCLSIYSSISLEQLFQMMHENQKSIKCSTSHCCFD